MLLSARRPLRNYVVAATIALFIVYTVANQAHFGSDRLPATDARADAGEGGGGDEGELGGRDLIGRFVGGFPKLRGPGNLGVPSDLKARSAAGGDGTARGFDWPRMTKRFVLCVTSAGAGMMVDRGRGGNAASDGQRGEATRRRDGARPMRCCGEVARRRAGADIPVATLLVSVDADALPACLLAFEPGGALHTCHSSKQDM